MFSTDCLSVYFSTFDPYCFVFMLFQRDSQDLVIFCCFSDRCRCQPVLSFHRISGRFEEMNLFLMFI